MLSIDEEIAYDIYFQALLARVSDVFCLSFCLVLGETTRETQVRQPEVGLRASGRIFIIHGRVSILSRDLCIRSDLFPSAS